MMNKEKQKIENNLLLLKGCEKKSVINRVHTIQTQKDAPRFHSLKNLVDYLKKITGPAGTGPVLSSIIPPADRDEPYTIKDIYLPEHHIKKDMPSILNILHWHQPLGNVAKGIYRGIKEYMDVLYQYYRMQLEVWEEFIINNPEVGYIETIHITGTLITWMSLEHPEWLQRFARLVRGEVTGTPGEKPHCELFVSPYYESLASTLPVAEAVRQTSLSIEVMNFFGMKPSGFWLVERIWEPAYFSIFTKELRKLGINKAAIDDHLFYKMNKQEVRACGFSFDSFTEKDLRGYYILDDELKESDPFYILPANRDYRQARPYWLSEIPRKGGRFTSYWLEGYIKGSIPRKDAITLVNGNTQVMDDLFIKHPFLSFHEKELTSVIFKDDFINRIPRIKCIDQKAKTLLIKLWEKIKKDKFLPGQFLVWAGDGEKSTNLWRYMGNSIKHNEDITYARQWLYGELKAKKKNHYANYLPSDQVLERSRCCGYITLPFGAYKEMTWWAHTTSHQVRLNTLIAKVENLKTQLLDYSRENTDHTTITDKEIQMYERLSNTEIRKYRILLHALHKRNGLETSHLTSFSPYLLSNEEVAELNTLEKGVPWKNFWIKYYESYKYHRLWFFLYQLTSRYVENKKLKTLILNLLGRATVNCGSWHGVFGGRYLANLRHDMMWGIAAAFSVYLYALREQNLFVYGNALVYSFDIMGEVRDELRSAGITIKNDRKKKIPDIFIITCQMVVVISLKNGGTLFEWIYFNTGNPLSMINTLNLIPEPYHEDAKNAAEWFKRKCDLYDKFIAIAVDSLNNFIKEDYSIIRDTIQYTEFQEKLTALKPVYDRIIKKNPVNKMVISLYNELIAEPVFIGTKTKIKPVQNLKVDEALKMYDTRLPVHQILRLRDRQTGKELGSFDTIDFQLNGMMNYNEWYEVSIKAETGRISVVKQYRIYKKRSFIIVIYKIMTYCRKKNIEVEIESNTNLPCFIKESAWIEINGRTRTINGVTEIPDVHSLSVVHREENIRQEIWIQPVQNRLVIQPRYSVSQGLRMFELTQQYIRYSFFIPLCIQRDNPGMIIISHSLDSLIRKDEEDEWFKRKGEYW